VFRVTQQNNQLKIEELRKSFSHLQKIYKMIKIYNSQTNIKFKVKLLAEMEF